MNLLSIEHLSKSYSRRQLFDDTSFFLQEGEKVGIIGINGTGKSTLLKIMAGLEETDEGTVTKANHAVIAYLPQHPVFDPEMTALDCVLAGHRELSGPESGQAEKRDHQDEAALVTKAKTMLTKLGVSSFDRAIRWTEKTPCAGERFIKGSGYFASGRADEPSGP